MRNSIPTAIRSVVGAIVLTACICAIAACGRVTTRRAYLTLNPSWFHTGSMMTNIEVRAVAVVITATSMPTPGSTP